MRPTSDWIDLNKFEPIENKLYLIYFKVNNRSWWLTSGKDRLMNNYFHRANVMSWNQSCRRFESQTDSFVPFCGIKDVLKICEVNLDIAENYSEPSGIQR